jgi:hypothetical protein
MTSPRQPLFERLPEIYRIRDTEQTPYSQLEAFLGVIEDAMSALHARTDAQYHDLFIEHCDDWVVAYIADLLGTTRLSGDPWTLRADVARTVFHRRRKGTLGAVESQVYALSGWAAHAVEMRERLGWHQHLNHQRPDVGGTPPLKLRTDISSPVRGGMASLRDPALLSLVNGPFDPFARVVNVKPPTLGMSGWNLPNLAVLLWRLEAFQTPLSRPVFRLTAPIPPATGTAALAVRFDIQPQGEPWPLFNTHRFHADEDPPRLGHEDEVPGPIPEARLSDGRPAGRSDQYVSVQTYTDPRNAHPGDAAVGLVLHLPEAPFLGQAWQIRGANLCAWEAGLAPALREWEIAIDPERGRVVFGVPDSNPATQAVPLANGLLVSATHALAGPTGAQPVSRTALPDTWPAEQPYELKRINWFDDEFALRHALDNLPNRTQPLVIEITDSQTHVLDLNAVLGIGNDAGVLSLRLPQALWIRSAPGERPTIRLRQPLRLRPTQITGPTAVNTEQLEVTLEGLYLTRDAAFPAADALITQAAIGQLNILGCTLDPGGVKVLDGSPTGKRATIRQALNLTNSYGLAAADLTAFDQVPRLTIQRSITGPLAIDTGYLLNLTDSIVDAGSGIAASTPFALAIGAATGNADLEWGPDLVIQGVTIFGRTRVQTARGESGLFVHRLEVHDNQDSHTVGIGVGLRGSCLKFCWFSGEHDRLPQHFGCVFAREARLRFTAEWFGQPGYAQLRPDCDKRIREDGSHNDEMGAFGYLLNTHKWKNIGIRLREFMPVGVRPVLIPIT